MSRRGIEAEERYAPVDARTPDDLIPLVNEGGSVIFRKRFEPSGDEPAMFTAQVMGEYSNFGLPTLEWSPKLAFEKRPRAQNGPLDRIPLNAAENVFLRFKGPVQKMAHFYHMGTGLALVSNELHELIQKLDPNAFEARPVSIADAAHGTNRRFWIIQSQRVVDAVDVHKTDVTIRRTEHTTLVSYYDGFVLRPDIAEEALFFKDRFHHAIIWRAKAFQAAADAGLYGFFGMSKGRLELSEEVRLPGPYYVGLADS